MERLKRELEEKLAEVTRIKSTLQNSEKVRVDTFSELVFILRVRSDRDFASVKMGLIPNVSSMG